jgi:hypothetical protein
MASWHLAGSGNAPLHRAAARTSSDTHLSRRVFSPFKENTAHVSTKNTPEIRCARSYRALRDGSFPRHAFPGTACQATIAVSLRDALATESFMNRTSRFHVHEIF